MFFYISKLLWFFVVPSNLLTFMVVVGAVLFWAGRIKWAKRLILTGGSLLLVFGLSPLGNLLALPLEERFPHPDLSKLSAPPTGIIILGGGTDTMVSKARGVVALTEAGDRFTEGLILAHRFPQAKIVLSGGSVEVFYKRSVEADVADSFFKSLGIAADRLIPEPNSRNTYENAKFTKQAVKPKPGEHWILVTSAIHMPRSVGCFRTVGFDVIPWAADYRTRGPQDIYKFFDKVSSGLRRMDAVTREYIGLIVYWLSGRTSQLLPS